MKLGRRPRPSSSFAPVVAAGLLATPAWGQTVSEYATEPHLQSQPVGEFDLEGAVARFDVAAARTPPTGEWPRPHATRTDPTADAATPEGAEGPDTDEVEPVSRFVHGFRLGYLYLSNYERDTVTPDDEDCPNCSLKERHDVRTPHQFLIGYEVMGRVIGHDILNVIVVANATISGIEQSRFFPSANLLAGFELNNSFQFGVGMNLTAEKEKPVHMIAAAGWTPRVGSFNVPVHFFFIPDVDYNHRMGATVGVNW